MNRNLLSRVATALLVAVLVLSCGEHAGRQITSRLQQYGPATLLSVYRSVPASGRRIALLHILFLPAVDVSKTTMEGSGVSIDGTAERGVIDYVYTDSDNRSIHAQPLHFHEDRTLGSGDRSFELKLGNLFVAGVSPSGAIQLSQLRISRRDEGEPAASVLRQIQAALPQNARVQALVPR